MVFFQARFQIAIGDFQFLAEMRYLPLQLSVRPFQRTCGFCERREGTGERMLGFMRRFSWPGEIGGHANHPAKSAPTRQNLP